MPPTEKQYGCITTRGTIWPPYHGETICLPKPRGIQSGCRTTRKTICLPSHEGYNMAAEPRGIQYGYRNHEGYTHQQRNNMAAEITRVAIWLPKPQGIQYGCRTMREQYGCHTSRDTIWLPNHEGYNMAAALRKKQYGRSAVYPTMKETGRGRGRGSRVVPMVALPGSSFLLSYWSSQLSSAASNPGSKWKNGYKLKTSSSLSNKNMTLIRTHWNFKGVLKNIFVTGSKN
jgi:hypothetical protein